MPSSDGGCCGPTICRSSLSGAGRDSSPAASVAAASTIAVVRNIRARRLRIIAEPVADAEDGLDQFGPGAIAFELAPEVHDVRVDGAVERVVVVAEGALREIGARPGPPRV